MKSKLKLLSLMALGFLQSFEVVAFFTDPSAGATAAYKEGDFVMVGTPPANRTVATEGKQVIISLGTKSQILAFSAGPSDPNPHWFAPDRNWLNVVFNNGAATPNATTGLDLDTSDLVFGTGQTVVPTFDLTKVIPFKKVGNKIVFDATLGGSTAVTVVSGLGVSNVPPVVPTVPAVNAPAADANGKSTILGNTATGMKGWAWYIWAIIAVAVVGVGLLLKSLFGGKKGKVVKK